MTPSERIISAAAKPVVTDDRCGRRLTLRPLTALDTLRLFKAAGPALAQNEPWLSMASLAFSVTEIDGVPVPAPANEAQIESIIDRLGDDGLAAIAAALEPEAPANASPPSGNSAGTPS